MTLRTATRTTAPAAPLIDYNAERPGRADALAALIAVAVLVVGTLAGLGILALARPAYGAPAGWQVVAGWAGLGLLALVALGAGGALWIVAGRYYRWREISNELLDLEIETRRANGGQVVTEERSSWDYDAGRVDHLLLTALSLAVAYERGQEVLPSIPALRERGVWIGRNKLAGLTSHDARLMLAEFASLGLVQGRQEGQAGAWCADVRRVIEAFEGRR